MTPGSCRVSVDGGHKSVGRVGSIVEQTSEALETEAISARNSMDIRRRTSDYVNTETSIRLKFQISLFVHLII